MEHAQFAVRAWSKVVKTKLQLRRMLPLMRHRTLVIAYIVISEYCENT